MPRRDPLEAAAEKKASAKKQPPFPFILDEIEDLGPRVNPMFASHGVYIGDKIVFILRDKGPTDSDRGMWVVSEKDQTQALLKAFPSLRPIDVLGEKIGNWKKLSANAKDFEENALAVCELVRRRDPRVGKIPESKKPKAPKVANAAATKKTAAPEAKMAAPEAKTAAPKAKTAATEPKTAPKTKTTKAR